MEPVGILNWSNHTQRRMSTTPMTTSHAFTLRQVHGPVTAVMTRARSAGWRRFSRGDEDGVVGSMDVVTGPPLH